MTYAVESADASTRGRHSGLFNTVTGAAAGRAAAGRHAGAGRRLPVHVRGVRRRGTAGRGVFPVAEKANGPHPGPSPEHKLMCSGEGELYLPSLLSCGQSCNSGEGQKVRYFIHALIHPSRTYLRRRRGRRPRYAAALAEFARLYGAGDVAIYRRAAANLIGEHTDYNHGFVLPVALDKDAVILARLRPDAAVRLANVEDGYAAVALDISKDIRPMRPAPGATTSRAAQALARGGPPAAWLRRAGGQRRAVRRPGGSGLSSSSALTVAAAVTVAHLNGLSDGTSHDAHFARLCADAEWYVGTRGGIMDHFASVLGRRGHAMFLDCRPGADGEYRTEHVPLPEGYRLLVVDSGVHHRNVGGGYNQRAECRGRLGLLRSRFPGITHLRDVQEQAWDDLARPCRRKRRWQSCAGRGSCWATCPVCAMTQPCACGRAAGMSGPRTAACWPRWTRWPRGCCNPRRAAQCSPRQRARRLRDQLPGDRGAGRRVREVDGVAGARLTGGLGRLHGCTGRRGCRAGFRGPCD